MARLFSSQRVCTFPKVIRAGPASARAQQTASSLASWAWARKPRCTSRAPTFIRTGYALNSGAWPQRPPAASANRLSIMNTHHFTRFPVFYFWIAIIISVGCAGTSTASITPSETPTREELRSNSLRHLVFNGREDRGNRYLSTVMIGEVKSQYPCSGVVIHPRLVLTAAHCLCNPRNGRKLVDATTCSKTARVTAYVYESAQNSSLPRRQSTQGIVRVHEGYRTQFRPDGTTRENVSDLAVIFLEKPLGG